MVCEAWRVARRMAGGGRGVADAAGAAGGRGARRPTTRAALLTGS
ncbi:MAG TPA: hypothetical protein VMV29_18325 [Ktedonobacterales bacterium]|nr:hypothetical protein [Ktedonobacterales bacterium]